MLAAGLIVSRFLHYAAILALFGSAVFTLYASAPALDRGRPPRWLRLFLIAAAALGLVSGIGWFVFTVGSMAGALADVIQPQVLRSVILSTDFGPLWLARLATLLVALGVVLVMPASTRPAGLLAFIAAVALASLAATGHARVPEGRSGLVHALFDAAHLLGAGLWLGGLWPLGVAVAGARRGWPSEQSGLADLLKRFSGMGYVAVATLLVSGVANSWYLVGSFGQLTTTPYGRLLLAKIALFLGMTALAAVNRVWITPALTSGVKGADPRWVARLRANVILEQSLGLMVVAAVSVLGILQTGVET
jgi:putative copper resistance protein D